MGLEYLLRLRKELSVLVAGLADFHLLLVIVALAIVGLRNMATERDGLLEGAVAVSAFICIFVFRILRHIDWIRGHQIRFILLLNRLAMFAEHNRLNWNVGGLIFGRLLNPENLILALLGVLFGGLRAERRGGLLFVKLREALRNGI